MPNCAFSAERWYLHLRPDVFSNFTAGRSTKNDTSAPLALSVLRRPWSLLWVEPVNDDVSGGMLPHHCADNLSPETSAFIVVKHELTRVNLLWQLCYKTNSVWVKALAALQQLTRALPRFPVCRFTAVFSPPQPPISVKFRIATRRHVNIAWQFIIYHFTVYICLKLSTW